MKKFDYENKLYLEKLNELNLSYYSKYISFIRKCTNKNSLVLDVGCGNGIVLYSLQESGYKNLFGIDISKLFVKDAKSKGLDKVYYYNGNKFPFKDEYFDLIGSFNVLEHTESPDNFIKEQVKKLKKGGFIIVSCPNFLSVLFNSPHRKLKGLKNKSRNLKTIFRKLTSSGNKFEKIKPVFRKDFQYDDDAIVITNLIDLKNVLKSNGCEVVYESGFINYDSIIFRTINSFPFMRYLLPSCFVVAKKTK